jgi:serine/threonine-protein kinase
MNAQLNDMPPDPALLNPLLPAAVSTVILRALAKEPGHRFQTALEFQAALTGLSRSEAHGEVPAAEVSAQELADLEARLSRAVGPIARRLVSDAARRHGTMPEIRRALALEIADPKAREHFLKTSPGSVATTVAHTHTAAVSFDPATLDRFVQALAPYLGPIAKIVVARAARKARNTEELQNALAAELPSTEDRRRFLAALRSVL